MKPAQTILVAEDDDDDFFFTLRALTRTTSSRVVRVESGRAVIDYLRGEAPYDDRTAFPMPDWLLLDLKMDDLDGVGVLSWLREHPLPGAPKTFVLTGSGEQRDRDRVRATGMAANYFVKPLTPAHVAEMHALAG